MSQTQEIKKDVAAMEHISRTAGHLVAQIIHLIKH